MLRSKHIIYCDCGGERICKESKQTVEKCINDSGVGSTTISDLCGVVVTDSKRLTGIFKPDTEYMVIGCYRRTMDLLFSQVSGNQYPDSITCHVNLIETPVEELNAGILEFCAGQGNETNIRIEDDREWPSWYPVIDYSRCTGCGQCADFCLFGVYEKSGNQVKVVNPRGCKNNCPACARICPTVAIIFPKYLHGGAIGGSDEIDESAEQQRQTRDIEQILGNDIYAALERRRIKRKSIIREEILQKALAEREQALGGSIKY